MLSSHTLQNPLLGPSDQILQMWWKTLGFFKEFQQPLLSRVHLRGNEGQQGGQAHAPLGHGYGQAQPLHRRPVPQPLYAPPGILCVWSDSVSISSLAALTLGRQAKDKICMQRGRSRAAWADSCQ